MIARVRQRGISLIVGMIMLVLITLLVVTSFNIAGSHLKVINNVQIQNELESAANAAIERTISTSAFANSAGYTATEAIRQFETSSAGTTEQKTAVSVTVTAACEKAKILSNKEANTVSKDCIWDPDSGGAYIEGKSSAGNSSLCAEALWDVNAATKAPQDNRATMEVHQGVGTTVARSSVPTGCGA
jgi:Tfp pilus assembly protein PilX